MLVQSCDWLRINILKKCLPHIQCFTDYEDTHKHTHTYIQGGIGGAAVGETASLKKEL